MSRRFTASAHDQMIYGSAGLMGLNFTFGTCAVVIRRIVDTGIFNTVMTTNSATNPSYSMVITDLDVLGLYPGTGSTRSHTGVTLALDTTYLLATTKATGTATPVGHRYVFNTNTWTQGNTSGTAINGATVTSMRIGAYQDAVGEPVDGEIWAFGLWQGYAMSNGEVQRLARGNWLNYSPTFYEEYSHGRETGDSAATLGRNPARITGRQGTTRGVATPPPGFRFCVQRRRR